MGESEQRLRSHWVQWHLGTWVGVRGGGGAPLSAICRDFQAQMPSSSREKKFRWEGVRYMQMQYNWRGYGGGQGNWGCSWGLLQAVRGPAGGWGSCPCCPPQVRVCSELTWKPQGGGPGSQVPLPPARPCPFLLREMRGPAGRGLCLFSSLGRRVPEKSSFLRIATKNSGRGRPDHRHSRDSGWWRFLEKTHQPQAPCPRQ